MGQYWWKGVALLAAAWTVAACATAPTGSAQLGAPAEERSALPPLGFLALCARAPAECYDSRAAAEGRSVAATAARLEQALGAGRKTSKPAALRRAAGQWSSESWSNFFSGAADVDEWSRGKAGLSAPADLTPELWGALHEVNDLVNRRVVSRSDRQIFGVSDYWALPFDRAGAPLGDCEDYVLQKRRLLIERGMAPSALSVAIVKLGRDLTHAVLLVETDGGRYVLDSLSPHILPSKQVRYHWLERQVAGEAFVWTMGSPDAQAS